MKEGISAVVCCYNSEKRLLKTLQHLVQQQVINFNWEIIVVDNASTDSTSALATDILSQNLAESKFKVVTESAPGLSNARKRGRLVAQYNFILFCDDDNWLVPTYLQSAFNIMNTHPDIAILGGNGEAIFENEKPDWFDKYSSSFAVGEQVKNVKDGDIAESYYVYGAGFVIRRAFFEALDVIGFKSLLADRTGSQLLSGGDSEFCILAHYLGYKVCYAPVLRFKHLMTAGRMSIPYLLGLYNSFGHSNIYLFVYRHCSESDIVPGQNLRFPLWLDTLISKGKIYIRHWMKSLGSNSLDEKLQLQVMKGELQELYSLKEKYTRLFEQTIALRKNINAYKQKVK